MLGRQSPGGMTPGLMCFLLAALSGACNTPEPNTQVMLIIDADAEVKALASLLQVEVEGRSEYDHIEGLPASHEFQTMEPSLTWPFSISLLPRARDARRFYSITARLFSADGPIAVLRAHSGFVAQRTLELRLYFSASCLREKSLDCREQETCYDGTCVSARIEVESLQVLSGDISNGFAPAADGGLSGRTSSNRTSPIANSSGAGRAGGKAFGVAGAGGMSEAGRGSTPGTGGASASEDMMSGGDCGDGSVNNGEKCDTAIPPGGAGACPSACETTIPCEPNRIQGSGCQTFCMPYPITIATPGDGCCPSGADASSDDNCATACGNGSIEVGETCDPSDTCPNATTCTGASACLLATTMGAATSCNVTCIMHKVDVCTSGDGCCPDICTNATDSDCSASCGNGFLDAGETCEPASASQPCPSSCDDSNPCTEDYLTGSADNCNVACTHVPITSPRNADSCCPTGGNANNDNDCPPVCGNGVREGQERCDGRCLTESLCNDLSPCTTETLTGTAATCDVQCVYNIINTAISGDSCCPFGANANNDDDCAPVCGNLVIESGELCDGDCPTSARSCDDNNACTSNEVAGMNCQRTCLNRPLSANRTAADGCCPGGATTETDLDCAGCGNGRVEAGESCDPCPTSCPPPNNCVRHALTGSGCNAACTDEPITTAAPNDRCCPSGQDSSTDNDCTNPPEPVCGNRMVEAGEMCDPCPMTCPASSNCIRHVLTGSGCNAHCTDERITAPAPKDDCCPPGQDSSTDNDCTNAPPPRCGDGNTDPGEMCDPCPMTCPTASNCIRHMLTGSGCNAHCTEERITTPAPNDECCPPGEDSSTDNDCPNPPEPVCGNDRIETGEVCDPPSATCLDCTSIVLPSEPSPGPPAR